MTQSEDENQVSVRSKLDQTEARVSTTLRDNRLSTKLRAWNARFDEWGVRHPLLMGLLSAIFFFGILLSTTWVFEGEADNPYLSSFLFGCVCFAFYRGRQVERGKARK